MTIIIKELMPDMWAHLEELFGSNGACGGCWCMSWRTEKGEKWEYIKGEEAKNRQKALVLAGKSHGLLAYINNKPIGWCSFGSRQDYPKLNRAPSLKCNDADKIWSIPCFFIHKDYRNQGVGLSLLMEALVCIKKRGGKIAEGYPVKAYNYGKKIPSAFAWTGTLPMFEKAQFTIVDDKCGGKQRVRKDL